MPPQKFPEIKTLVVDDEDLIAALASGVATETLGKHVDTASSAEEAKIAWLKSKHDLIVLDLHLPGISGEDFCRWIREHPDGKDVFVLICTGDNKIETFRNILTLGANDYITKPLQPKLLSVRMEIAKHTIHESHRRKALQTELSRNENRFRLISENSRDLVCTHAADGTLTYASPSCQNLLGYHADELIGKNFDEVKIDPRSSPVNLNALADEINGQLESTQIWEAKTKNGRTIWLETFSQPSVEGNDGVTEIYSYSRDVTQQKQEEAQLKILSVLGEETDAAGFLDAIIKEMEERLDSSVMIHIHGKPGERETYRIPQGKLDQNVEKFHRELDKNTNHEKPTFQSMGAAGVFNHLPGSEDFEAVITQPITGNFGRPIGKITICKKTPLAESERTKAILLLCGSKIGNVLEEHVTR